MYDIETEFRSDPQRFTASRNVRKTVVLTSLGVALVAAALVVVANFSAFYDYFGPTGDGVGSRHSSGPVLRFGTSLFPVLIGVIGFFFLAVAYRAKRWHRLETGAPIVPVVRRSFRALPGEMDRLARAFAAAAAESFLPLSELDSKGGGLLEIWFCQRDRVAYVLVANRIEKRRIAFLELRAGQYEVLADAKQRGLLTR